MLVLNLSLLNRAYTLINVMKALVLIIFMCGLPCNFLVEDYIEIFYAIYKWNIPSFQHKKRLRLSNSMREVDCPSLIFIHFNVQMLTPGRIGVF
jgi:hypothetical protein